MSLKFGLATPNAAEGIIFDVGFVDHRTTVGLSVEAEALGFDSVWTNDHITTQKYLREFVKSPPNHFDPLVTQAFIAEATKKIRLGTAVVVLPYRNPVILAKQVATLDRLSRGRLILGLGTGAYREEFEAINPTLRYEERGDLMDESVRALRLLLTKAKASFNGKYVKFSDVEMFPKPKQQILPLWMGGNSPRVMRRAGEMGDGWLPACLTPNAVREGASKIRGYARKAGRLASRVEIAPQYLVLLGKTREDASRKFRRSLSYKHLVSLQKTTMKGQLAESYEASNLIGTPTQVIEQIDALQKAGVSYFSALVFMCEGYGDFLRQAKVFAKEVIPSFR